jgi:ABC-2 type transport system ATP-binding protein
MAISNPSTTDFSIHQRPARPSIARLANVSLAFGDGAQALDRFSLDVAPGECLGILGPNGAGKTSLLRLLAGLLLPTAGQVELFGQPLHRGSIATRCRIGYVSQQSGIDQYLSGQANIMLAGRLHGLRGQPLRQRTHDLLDLVGLRDHAHRRASRYSGGMRRRLALACSLVHRPELLLLDEPTTGLDSAGKAALWNYLRLLQQDGPTIIVTSHDTLEIERWCSRVVLMNRGQLLMQGAPAHLIAHVQGDLLTLELAEPQQASYTRHLLQEQPYILSALQAEAETQIRLEARDGPAAIPQIVRLLEAAGLPLQRLTLNRPTLEDVFFRATGISLAEPERLAETSAPKPSRHRSSFRRFRQRGQP